MNKSTIKIRLMQAEDFDVVAGIDEKKEIISDATCIGKRISLIFFYFF